MNLVGGVSIFLHMSVDSTCDDGHAFGGLDSHFQMMISTIWKSPAKGIHSRAT